MRLLVALLVLLCLALPALAGPLPGLTPDNETTILDPKPTSVMQTSDVFSPAAPSIIPPMVSIATTIPAAASSIVVSHGGFSTTFSWGATGGRPAPTGNSTQTKGPKHTSSATTTRRPWAPGATSSWFANTTTPACGSVYTPPTPTGTGTGHGHDHGSTATQSAVNATSIDVSLHVPKPTGTGHGTTSRRHGWGDHTTAPRRPSATGTGHFQPSRPAWVDHPDAPRVPIPTKTDRPEHTSKSTSMPLPAEPTGPSNGEVFKRGPRLCPTPKVNPNPPFNFICSGDDGCDDPGLTSTLPMV